MMKNEYYDSQVFAQNLKKMLNKHNMLMKELAEYVGVSRPTISEWCSGKKLPRIDKVEKMCVLFNCKKSDLIGNTNSQTEDAGTRDILYAFGELSKSGQYKLLAYAYQLIEEEDNEWKAAHSTPPVLERIKKEASSAATEDASHD